MVQWSHQLLQNPNAKELMQIMAVSGLAQNFAALRSLVTTGIQKGHMKMHLLNILNQMGATQSEKEAMIKHFTTNVVRLQCRRTNTSSMAEKLTYYSAGKLLITSEYAVIDGACALALPTKLGQRMSCC